MEELESLLQEKIERLEAGESLDVCLTGLPEQESNVLRLVTIMREAQFPEQDSKAISEQRTKILDYAQQTFNGNHKPSGVSMVATAPSLLDQIRSLIDRMLSRRELAFGAVVLLVFFACISLFLITAGFGGWMLSRDHQVADVPGVANPNGEKIDKQPVATEQNVATEVAISSAPSGTPVSEPEYVSVARPTLTVPEIDPKTASVRVVQGIAEIQTGNDGEWVIVNQVGTLIAGQQIRTGAFSKVILAFYDGSEAHLGANTVIFVDELDAQLAGKGARIVKLTQRLGETEHLVATRDEKGARYKITTPGGIGTAQGTKFSVLVTEDLLTRFAVAEGEIEVNSLGKAVVVKPGQSTLTIAGQKPGETFFQINGEGEVSQMGLTWVIAGQSFQTNNHTLIVGNPQVGDLVRVEGHLTGKGVNVAVRIILLRRAIANQFTLNGKIEAIGTELWTISGQEIVINAETEIAGDPQVGDSVYVSGVILTGGTLLAEQIALVEDQPGLPFFFTGLVQEVHENFWVISDKVISIGTNTVIGAEVGVGDLVTVRGRILEGNIWLAHVIVAANHDATFEFTGTVQSMAPWQVSGISFEIRDWTVIDLGIEAGDLVRVKGVILSDGTWVATHIASFVDFPQQAIVFIGIVSSTDPWVVNGIPLVITDDTIIAGNIEVGTPVIVMVQLLEDGTWVVLSIRPIFPQFGFGCLMVNATVTSITGNQIILGNWTPITLGDDISVDGELEENSVILFNTCVLYDGTVIIIHIIVIYQPVIIIIPDPPRGNGNKNG